MTVAPAGLRCLETTVASPVLIKNRYEIKDVLGRGGMGVVYRAFDALMRREVAVKTLRDASSAAFVELFYRECSVLSAMVHPNIVEIFDMGDFEEDGVRKPFFVMPLLPGRTLYDLLYPSGQPLPVARCTDIISQACRGLQAAHECGLLHLDIKPRNIFVMPDDAVKLIDFGVVRLRGSQTFGTLGTLGTLQYMAPEQIAKKDLTARCDIFSLATVCYEALTGIHPFARGSEEDTAAAIAEHTPELVCTLNPMVTRPLAQTLAQAMAKDPRNRFETAAAFADALQKGLRNERSGAAAITNSQDRLARAKRSFARGDYEFTKEIVEQLEAEGMDGAEVRDLRAQLNEAIRRRNVEVRVATARRYFEQEEHALALRRVGEVLESDPADESALSLKNEIESKLRDLHAADCFQRAADHLDSGNFTEAKRAIEGLLAVQPSNDEAQRFLRETEQRAEEWPRQRRQQEELFQTAQGAYFAGRFDTALQRLEELAEWTSRSKAAGARAAEYRDFHKRVRGDYDAVRTMLADARKLLASGDLDGAQALSERLRERCPEESDLRLLDSEISARRDEREAEYRRGIADSIASEPDLSARLHILNQAVRARPADEFFFQERQKLQALVQKVTELEQRAQVYESSGRYDYAVEEWLCVGDLYPAYPGLLDQIARVQALWEGAREHAKSELGLAVSEALKRGDQARAATLLKEAQPEFQGEAEYLRLQTLFESAAAAQKETAAILSQIQKAEGERRYHDLPALCQAATRISGGVDLLREACLNTLIGAAWRVVSQNWRVAEQVAQEAGTIGGVPADLQEAIGRQRREEEVGGLLREEHAGGGGSPETYRERLAAMLAKYPDESRLEDRMRFIDAALADQRKIAEKRSCAAELALLCDELGDATDHWRLWDGYLRAKSIAGPLANDPEVAPLLEAIREQSSVFEEAADALSRDHIKDCLTLCDKMLMGRPGHVLFQQLRDRATNRHRQLGEDHLARVERWLASEPDVYQRELILQKAQEEYPFETRYAEELHQLQREKAIAESIATKARDLEKRGQIAEALAQWRQLRNVHSGYPGLAEQIEYCESFIDRQQRKVRAQRLVSHGQAHLADGHLEQGYELIREASELSGDIAELLRFCAPNLAAAARATLPANPRLAEAMADLAQSLDDALRLPKDMRAKIQEACKAEDTANCLKAVQGYRESGDLAAAVATAEQFLDKYPGVKEVESARARLSVEVDQQRREQARAQVLDQFREMELGVSDMGPTGLLRLKENLHELAHGYSGDEEVSQRVSTLELLFGTLAEIRALLYAHDSPSKVEEACERALAKFPDHPLFQSALAEAGNQRAQLAAHEINTAKLRVEAERDFEKQAAILQDVLGRHPAERSLAEELERVNGRREQLNSRVEKARELETKRLLGEALREWEAIGNEYPWYTPAKAELERVGAARRAEKQTASDRWLGQVQSAIENCDYETASVMLQQAGQQYPEHKLKALDQKLKEGQAKKQTSDAKFAQGRGLLAEGRLAEGGKALQDAFELQPRDREKANAIAMLLLGQIRANMESNIASCQSLLAILNLVRPGQVLPADIHEAITKKRRGGERTNNNRPTKESLELTVRQKAAVALVAKPISQPETRFAAGSAAAAAILLLCFAALVYFLASSRQRTVAVQFSLTPDRVTVELDGHTCIAPDCKFTLKPGEYHLNFRKSGYKPKSVVVTVREGEFMPLNVTAVLEPLPAVSNIPQAGDVSR